MRLSRFNRPMRVRKDLCSVCGELATRYIGRVRRCEGCYKIWVSQRCQGKVFDGRCGYMQCIHSGTDRVKEKLYCWQHVERARQWERVERDYRDKKVS